MASAKAAARYSSPKGGKKLVPEVAEASKEAEASAGSPPKIDEGNVPEKVTKVGEDKGPTESEATGEKVMGDHKMRHEHEEAAMHHRHMLSHSERHHRHAMERHGAEESEMEAIHARHEKEHKDAHTHNEHEMRQMHERHRSDLAAPGEEAAEKKPTEKNLSLVSGGKK